MTNQHSNMNAAVTDEYDEAMLPGGWLAGTVEGWLIKLMMSIAGLFMRLVG